MDTQTYKVLKVFTKRDALNAHDISVLLNDSSGEQTYQKIVSAFQDNNYIEIADNFVDLDNPNTINYRITSHGQKALQQCQMDIVRGIFKHFILPLTITILGAIIAFFVTTAISQKSQSATQEKSKYATELDETR